MTDRSYTNHARHASDDEVGLPVRADRPLVTVAYMMMTQLVDITDGLAEAHADAAYLHDDTAKAMAKDRRYARAAAAHRAAADAHTAASLAWDGDGSGYADDRDDKTRAAVLATLEAEAKRDSAEAWNSSLSLTAA